jgi:CheY-like chemotaxis protein
MTDVVMPGMSGHELAQQMRQVRPDIKILYMIA